MEKSLAVAWPLTDEQVWTNFLLSWTLMIKPREYTLLTPKFYGHIDAIRNNLVAQAYIEGINYMIMMDTDQTYPTDTLPKLIEWMDKGYTMVGAVVHRRYPPFDAILYRGNVGSYSHVPDEEIYSGDLIEVDATGGGCFMVNVDKVLETIGPNWFKLDIGPTGKPVGEDIFFCSLLRRNRIKIFIDTSVQCGHKSTLEINRGTYELYRKLKGYEWNKTEPEDDPHYIAPMDQIEGPAQMNLFDPI